MITRFKPGDIVRVKEAYAGGGRYAPDGHEGVYTVVRFLAPVDYKLIRGTELCGSDWEYGSDWDVIIHESRLEPVKGRR